MNIYRFPPYLSVLWPVICLGYIVKTDIYNQGIWSWPTGEMLFQTGTMIPIQEGKQSDKNSSENVMDSLFSIFGIPIELPHHQN